MLPRALLFSIVGLALALTAARAQSAPLVRDVEFQPFASATERLVEALDVVGAPLAAADRTTVQTALRSSDHGSAIERIQQVLDRYAIAVVDINAESRVKVAAGPGEPNLVQGGFRTFLVKVINGAGVTAQLVGESPNAEPVYRRSTASPEPEASISASDVTQRWLEMLMFDGRPLRPGLSGLALEYRIVQLLARDAGQREARLSFHVGQGTQDIGFRNAVPILFRCAPAVKVELTVLDVDGSATTAGFQIRDDHGRVYPAQSRRLAPDFFFHPQIYRKSGEVVLLPPGEYDVVITRGPEYTTQRRRITVPAQETHTEEFRLRRWIHLAELGWISGDHHIHAAGCSHYESPSQGVNPMTMWRHMLGEDLNVGCVLSWGPCWYHQKQFFQGQNHELSTDRYVMRYDVEVSGFPSSHAGHLSLIRLADDDYPGTTRIEEWPSWDLPVLQWAKRQGGIAGFSHSGWGLEVPGRELPNYNVPRFDGIGANEFVVDVVHDAVDFISTVDTPAIWELNIWYHVLNCGYRTRISGETDFPCIYDSRVGLGRSYVKLPPGPVDFDAWAEGIRDGRCYVSDGMSHLLDFAVDGLVAGTRKSDDAPVSQLDLAEPRTVAVTARVAARLPAAADELLRALPWNEKPYWHLERARIEGSREVPVELIVNGEPVARQEIVADGELRDVRFDVAIERSSWVTLRILPSSHSNPVFVIVAGQPVRANARSAEWCLAAVDRCWQNKRNGIRATDREAAAAAYEEARVAYRRILAACRDR